MGLSAADRLYLEKREQLARYWPWAGGILLLLPLLLSAWLWFEIPYLVNPWAVSSEILAETLPATTAMLMAAMLPVLMLTFIVFVIAMVLLAFAVFANERRLLRMVRQALSETAE